MIKAAYSVNSRSEGCGIGARQIVAHGVPAGVSHGPRRLAASRKRTTSAHRDTSSSNSACFTRVLTGPCPAGVCDALSAYRYALLADSLR